MTIGAPSALLALGALAAVVIVLFCLRALPRAGFALWASVAFLLPVWVGVAVGFHWPAIIALTVLLLVANAHKVPLHPADGVMAAFVTLVLGLRFLGGVTLGETVTAVTEWVIPYIWGRILLARVSTQWVTSVVTVLAALAAVLALIEFATSFNPFVLIPGSEPLHSSWNTLQERGGILRAEGAFGHSIALGATLAMSSAFAVAAPWRTAPKILAICLIAAATVVTFSRAGLITLVLTAVLSICLLHGVSRRFRVVVVGAGAIGVLVALPVINAVLGAAGDEAEGSAGYRTDLLVLLEQVRPFGNAGQWQTLVTGEYYLGYFARSIDNALMLTLLRYGAVPTALAVAIIVSAALLVLPRNSRNPAAIAVAGQLPSLVVVALITQYGAIFWFCVGLALSWPWARSAGADDEPSGTVGGEMSDARNGATLSESATGGSRRVRRGEM
ncbi:hypothetical protein ACT3SP_09185 [Brachybacterium sp. AOP43-C2-M15]|uniref:hypothetical protein n=1 Tax=Brachybacterium sp. AOP43-C2-M15 TaxID=3457661 RepID=UPI004033D880